MNFPLLSLGKKLWVTLTGLFLCVFLVIHLVGNLQLFYADQGLSFNKYSSFMAVNPLIRMVSWLLYVSIIVHALKGIHLIYQNRKARKVAYAKRTKSGLWYSRSMGLLGTIILVFIVVHMANFWYSYKFENIAYAAYKESLVDGSITKKNIPKNTEEVIHTNMEEFIEQENRLIIVKDLYQLVRYTFQENIWIVLLYVLSMVALGFHLIHGFQSAFQTLGIKHLLGARIIQTISVWVFGILIPLGFALIPVYIFFSQ